MDFGDKAEKDARTIFLRNVAFSAGEDDIRALPQFAQAIDVKLPTDRETGRPRGFGFIEFASPEECKAAIDGCAEGVEVHGRNLIVQQSDRSGNSGGGQRGGFRGRGRGRGRGGYGGGFQQGGYGGQQGGYGGQQGGYQQGGYQQGGYGGQQGGGYGGGYQQQPQGGFQQGGFGGQPQGGFGGQF